MTAWYLAHGPETLLLGMVIGIILRVFKEKLDAGHWKEYMGVCFYCKKNLATKVEIATEGGIETCDECGRSDETPKETE